ncbi:MAG TPA: alanine racemase [Solirubrobacteraceae bacterium]|nr:alanine racemase [Solirubrobacteraceae bacterium]
MSVGERAQAHVSRGAITRNCEHLASQLSAGTELCAVVKADGYGHGLSASAVAALLGGARRLAVATAQEAHELREGPVFYDAEILVMGALESAELALALREGAEVVVWSEQQVQAVAKAGGGRVHVKLDSGMGRLGTRDVEAASRVLALASETEGVEPIGLMTHFATADELEDDGFFAGQLEVFSRWASQEKARRPELIVHAANSAAVLREPASHFDMVRCGIAIYGMDPFGVDPREQGLEPALTLTSYLAEVKLCRAGESAGYGRRFIAERDTWLGVLPIGYGDGWRRGLSNNAEVLIEGARYPLVGTVSMDNATIDLGADAAAQGLHGARAVLIGQDGEQRITAEQVARRLGTINYEITCGLTPRVPRVYDRKDERRDEPADAAGQAASEV